MNRVQRMARGAAAGALAGAAGGAFVAACDFGALWMWLPLWEDRGWLVVRLFASLMPAGAVVGAILGLVFAALAPGVERYAARRAGGDADRQRKITRWSWIALVAAIAVVPAVLMGRKAMSGGSMARLAHHDVAVAGMAVVLVAAAAAAALIVQRLWAQREPSRARIWALALLALAFAITKAGEHVYPNLYGYLHVLLTGLAWATAAGAALLLPRFDPRGNRAANAPTFVGFGVLGAACLVFAVHVATMRGQPNVRVALVDPRASSSQSLMRGIEPLMRRAMKGDAPGRATEEARAAREKRRSVLAAGADLPTWEGANIVLVTIDALRADHLGTYGYARPTSPNIDAFAKTAVVFERAYAQAPHSSYSLSSVMTSEYLHETVDLDAPLPYQTLPRALARAGFQTAAFFPLGIFHTEGERLKKYHDDGYGFERRDHRDLLADELTKAVSEEITRVAGDGQPKWFVWVHYFDVHEPYRATTFGTSPMDRYDSEIQHVDRELGKLLGAIDTRLGRETIVVLSADHGEEFREHGGVYHGSDLYEQQVRVPLMIRAPDLSPRRIGGQVELVDIAPTLLAMAGAETPTSMRGDDLRAVLLGRVSDLGPAFSAVLHKRMAVRWPYKLIADFQVGLFELYDEAHDPNERINLAGQDKKTTEALTGEIYAWLDALRTPPRAQASAQSRDPLVSAVARGRLGDTRAVKTLADAVRNEKGDPDVRREAGRILGTLADASAAPALAEALKSRNRLVAAEAAIALGRLYDGRARWALQKLMYSDDADIRARAAISLARLRDNHAIPGLVDALWVASNTNDREEAVRWLGRLRDPRALEPLLELLPDVKLRHLTVASLGMLGDRRAYLPLIETLEWESRTDVRDQVLRGLGYLGQRDAVPRILKAGIEEPSMRNAAESLVRLGAIEAGNVAGTDLHRGATGVTGFTSCREADPFDDWNYRERTWCETGGPNADIRFRIPPTFAAELDAEGNAILIVRMRRTDSGEPVRIAVQLGSTKTETTVDGQWTEFRLPVPSIRGAIRVTLRASDPAARFGVDHVLLYPSQAPAPP